MSCKGKKLQNKKFDGADKDAGTDASDATLGPQKIRHGIRWLAVKAMEAIVENCRRQPPMITAMPRQQEPRRAGVAGAGTGTAGAQRARSRSKSMRSSRTPRRARSVSSSMTRQRPMIALKTELLEMITIAPWQGVRLSLWGVNCPGCCHWTRHSSLTMIQVRAARNGQRHIRCQCGAMALSLEQAKFLGKEADKVKDEIVEQDVADMLRS